ncbi:MAG: co-chaperone GroES [Calditrichaeota bacterium]|nr:MAG: co-chaperone GroES [Calditrichota bacterium]
MKLRPLGTHIIVRRLENEEKTPGGIIIPDTAKEKSQRGEVIAVGNGRVLKNGRRVPLDVREGDRILFSKYAGEEFKINGNEYVILEEDDVLAII